MEFCKPSGETPTEGGNAVSATVFCQSNLWIAHKSWPGWNSQRKAGEKWMNDWIVWDSNALLSSQVFLQRRQSRAWVLSTSAGYKLQIDDSSRSHGSTMLSTFKRNRNHDSHRCQQAVDHVSHDSLAVCWTPPAGEVKKYTAICHKGRQIAKTLTTTNTYILTNPM